MDFVPPENVSLEGHGIQCQRKMKMNLYSIWMHFDLLQWTASSAFEVFKIWVMMLK